MFDSHKPIQTREGLRARIICRDKVGTRRPIIALITLIDGAEISLDYYSDGMIDLEEPSRMDLVNVPEQIHKFLVFDSKSKSASFYESEQDMKNFLPSHTQVQFVFEGGVLADIQRLG
jgi:hypothetical protein